MRKIIKDFLPPIVLKSIKQMRNNKYGWKGNYPTWEEAENNASGYDKDVILEKVRDATLKVKNGEAVYERDSVLFDKIQYSWGLLSGLMYASAQMKGIVKVVDFGGSLGSTYFQNKKFLDGFSSLSWNVIEQEHFVSVGKSDFEDDRLHFYDDILTCIKQEQPDILVLSSVLQYIKEPYQILDIFLSYEFNFIVIDRTSFNVRDKDEIRLQIVSPSIYDASYPCWFFDRKKFIDYFVSYGYEIIEAFDGSDGKGDDFFFEGFILQRISYDG